MSNFSIPGSQSTPAIDGDWDHGILSMQGDSYPENSYELFQQVFSWVERFLLEAGLEPEKAFKRVAYSGAHDATIASVVSGKVDAAALDITVWKKFVAENKVDTKAVDVFYTTPPYYNYNWTVHQDMPADLRKKIQKALFDLDPAVPEHAEILKLNRSTRYIDTKPENYKGLESAARSAGLL